MIRILRNERIIPDLFENLTQEAQKIPIKFGSRDIQPGATVHKRDATHKPQIEFKSEAKYMHLVMVDPDAPSADQHTFRSWLHWMVLNIPDGAIQDGEEIIEYAPPTPPKGTGKHRYVFAIFGSDAKLKSQTIHERAKWSMNSFMKHHHLSDPIGVSYFLTEHE